MGSHVVRVVDTVVGTMVVAVVVIRAIAKVEVGSRRVLYDRIDGFEP